jgi:hypothetical protein
MRWNLCTLWRLYITYWNPLAEYRRSFIETFFQQLWILFIWLYCSTQMSTSVLLSLMHQTAPSTLPPQCCEWVSVVLGSCNCMYTYTFHISCIGRHVACVQTKFCQSCTHEQVCCRTWISKQVGQKCVHRCEYWKCYNFEMWCYWSTWWLRLQEMTHDGWQACWLVGWLVGWLAGRSVSCSVAWSVPLFCRNQLPLLSRASAFCIALICSLTFKRHTFPYANAFKKTHLEINFMYLGNKEI